MNVATWEYEFGAVCPRGHKTYARIVLPHQWWPAHPGEPENGLDPYPADPLPEWACQAQHFGKSCGAPTVLTPLAPPR